MTTHTLIQGFNNPTHDSQQVFRELLKAMSEPGTLISVTSPEAMSPLYATTFAVCQALLDQQTPLWLSPHLSTDDIKHNLHFHTGVSITEQRKDAHFALMNDDEVNSLDVFSTLAFKDEDRGFSAGTNEYPETGCTLLIQVESVNNTQTDALSLRLTGPGIETERLVSTTELPSQLLDYLTDDMERNAAFPLGFDCILIDPEQVMCIPRTTNVEVL